MKTPRIWSLVPAAALLAGATALAQNSTSTQTLNVRSTPVTMTVSTPGGVNVSTNVTTTSISIKHDGGGGSGGPNDEQVLRQVQDAMRQAMDKLNQSGAGQEALEQARQQMQSALAEVQSALAKTENKFSVRKSAIAKSGSGSVNGGALVVGGGGGGNAYGAKSTGGGFGGFGGGGRGRGMVGGMFGGTAPVVEPALIATSPLESARRGEWQEDLKVMDKLLRDELARVEGDAPRQALGIRLFLSDQASHEPIYLEGYGALFRYQVSLPLASSGKKAEGKTEVKPNSAWETARRELHTSTADSNQTVQVLIHTIQSGLSPAPAPKQFDAAKLDELVNALIGILGEAKNIRHLGAAESVTVTLKGTDDADAPVRLTFKVTKGDLDKLSQGKIKLEEFKQKVARSVG